MATPRKAYIYFNHKSEFPNDVVEKAHTLWRPTSIKGRHVAGDVSNG